MDVAPLSGTFMIASILGFFASVFVVFDYHPAFGFAFAVIFTLMFIASLISMTYADADAVLAVDMHKMKPVKSKRK